MFISPVFAPWRLGVRPVLIVLLALCVAYPATAATASPPPSAPSLSRLLPATTKAYLATDDFPQFRSAWQASQYGRLSNDESMQPFVDDVKRYLASGLRSQLPPLGVSWTDLAKLAHGPVCIAQVAMPENRPAFALLIQTDRAGGGADQLIERLGKEYAAAGAKRSAQQQGDVAIVTWQLPSLPTTTAAQKANTNDAENKAPRTIVRCYFTTGSLLGVTNDVALAKDVLARLAQPSPENLSTLEAFVACAAAITPALAPGRPIDSQQAGATQAGGSDQPPSVGTLRWFIEPFGLQDLLRAASDQPDDENHEFINRQGFEIIQGMGGTITVGGPLAADNPPLAMVRRTVVYAPGALEGAAQLLSFYKQPEFDAVPTWVPANVAQLSSLRWKLTPALRGYGAVFDQLYGDGLDGVFEDVLTEIRDDPESPGVDVRKDLIANLQSPLWIVRPVSRPTGKKSETPQAVGSDKVQPPVGQQPPAVGTLLAIRAKDPKAVATAVRKMLEGDPEVDHRTIAGQTVWVFRARDAEQDSAKAPKAGRASGDTAAASATSDNANGEEEEPAFGPDLSNFAFAVVGNYLYIATHVDAMQQMLEQPTKSSRLGDDADFRRALRAMKELGAGDTFAYQFRQGGEGLRSTYQRLRFGDDASTTVLGYWLSESLLNMSGNRTFAAESANDQKSTADGRVDFSLLPPLDVVKEYLQPAGAFAQLTDQGWSLVGFTLAPPAPRAGK